MKKQYANPSLRIVSLEDVDIVASSETVGMNGEFNPDKPVEAKQRNTIWDE